MADFNETLVRRYYELNGYLVRSNLQYRVPNGYSDVDLVCLNPISGDAVAVEVKGWHTERVTMGTFTGWPNLLNFTTEAATAAIRAVLGTVDFRRILVVSAIGSRSATKVHQHLAARGVETIEFSTILARLLAEGDTKKNADSDAEHLLRLLRIYGHVAS